MAKPIGDLPAASGIGANDKFVLEQSEIAKSLTGQILLNWLTAAADGHGGIKSVEKLSTSGLDDTYRITLADTTTFDFVVTNGRSINSITKTSTSGLVDTYTITYNNGTTSKFTVKNGETGQRGPQGSTGPKGDPATLVSSVSEYQVGDSGTNIPTGSWGTTIPAVAQGKYLWTRVTQNFNTGNPVVFYAVSRDGMDGSGSVVTVNNVSPDARGNVALTANDIGAEAKQKYGKLVVFGDSLGQGVNNGDYSFVDVLAESGAFSSVSKHCVGSATIGPYQVDSAAAGYSLVEQIERYSADVAAADIIMLEYGGNDVVAYNAGNIQMGTYSDTAETVSVCGYLAKAMARIRSLNPTAKIVWLAAFWDSYDSAKNAVDAGYADAWLLFQATAIRLARPYLIGVIPIFSGLSDAHLSSDGIHPNTTGHRQIANKITINPFGISDYPNLSRVLTLTGDAEAGTNLSIDAGYPVAKSLIGAGVTIRLEYNQYGGPMMLRPFVHNDYMMQFTGMSFLNGDYLLIAVNWEPDGSIAVSSKTYSGNL